MDWCGYVLKRFDEASRSSLATRREGISRDQLARAVFGEDLVTQEDFVRSTHARALNSVFYDLAEMGHVWNSSPIAVIPPKDLWKLDTTGMRIARDSRSEWSYWFSVCATTPKLGSLHEQLLDLVNRLSSQEAPSHAWVEQVGARELLAELGWEEELLLTVLQELRGNRELVYIAPRYPPAAPIPSIENLKIWANYRGLVLRTRRNITLQSQHIDRLVEGWETTSVEFKAELRSRTKDQKAELVKDLVGLANTQASGERLLVVGFDNETHGYHGSLDTDLTQDNLERIMSPYTEPYLDVRYEVVEYRGGPVGLIEVLRDPRKLPYKVARSVGDRKRIEEDQIFVRHGSQTEEPTNAELEAILKEGERARSEQ